MSLNSQQYGSNNAHYKYIRYNQSFENNKNNYAAHLPLHPIDLHSRNEINERRLKWLTEYSKNLPIPDFFGDYVSNQHFLDTVDLFINATLETRHRGLFFLKEIIPKLRRTQSLLDIGPGKGKLTSWIGRKFKTVTVVDNSPLALENIKEHSFPRSSLKKIEGDFINTMYPFEKFDLINMSHMIYYINKMNLIQNIKKAYELLSHNGILVIVYNEGLDREQLVNYFGAYPQSFDVFFKILSYTNNIRNIKIYTSKESFYTSDIIPMLHICGLHLHDQGIKVDRKTLENYVNEYYLTKNKQYSMNMYQKFVVIKKNN